MVLVIFAVMVTAGKTFFYQWSHFDDPETSRLFILYSVFIALLLIEHVPTVFLSALKYNRAPAIVGTLQGLLSLLFTYLLVPSWGITGAVMGSLAAFLLTNCFYNPAYLLVKINRHLRRVQANG